MIKKLFSIALIAAAVSANAQELKVGMENPVSAQKMDYPTVSMATIDTLKPVSAKPGGCATGTTTAAGFVFYSIDRSLPRDSGYWFGTGKLPVPGVTVTEIAQKYNVGTSAAAVTDILVWAAKAKGTVVTTNAKIYSENTTTKGPNAVLGTSTALPMSSYIAGGYTKFTFSTPVALTANQNFFAAITIPPFGGTDNDTLAVVSTKFGCSSTDTLSWMNLSPNPGWYSVKRVFTNGTVVRNLDLMIWPVIYIATTGVNSYVSKGDLSMYAASPNPANTSININFALNTASKVEIDVYDLTGKIVKSIKNDDAFSTGKHTISVDLTNLESGSYFYSINASGNKMFSKFVVTK